jgi:ribosomal protein S27E
MAAKSQKVKILCPRCGKKRLFDIAGMPDGEFDIEITCNVCGKVWIKSKDIRKLLTLEKN